MHDINFFSQLQSSRRLSSRSIIAILSVLVVIALNVTVIMFLNLQLDDKRMQLAQLNDFNNSAQSIQLLADVVILGEENTVKQSYYTAASTLEQDIKDAAMLTTDRLDKILAAVPQQVTSESFSYLSGFLSFECTSPPNADYLPRTIKALEDTGLFVSVNSEGVSFIDPTVLDETGQPVQDDQAIEDGQPTEPYCSFSIECVLKEGGQ